MSDQQDFSPDPRPECTSNVGKNDSHPGSLRLTRLRILRVHNGVHPDMNLAFLCKVSNSGVGDLLRLSEACQNRSEREGEKKLFHIRLPRFSYPASERGARNVGARVFLPEVDKLSSVARVSNYTVCDLWASRPNSGIGLVTMSPSGTKQSIKNVRFDVWLRGGTSRNYAYKTAIDPQQTF